MTPLLIFALALVALALYIFWIEPLGILPALERLTPNFTYRVRTRHPLVALSFDDGPHPVFTPQVLEILRQHNAQATFFLIGERALRHPELVARIKAAGHEVANHYFTDDSLLLRSGADFVRHLEQTEKVLGITAAPKFFRPPGGVARSKQLRLARARGYECVLGSAYPHDPMHPPVWYIRWLVAKNLAPGTIVILHDGISNPNPEHPGSTTNSYRRPPQGPPLRLHRCPESSRRLFALTLEGSPGRRGSKAAAIRPAQTPCYAMPCSRI